MKLLVSLSLLLLLVALAAQVAAENPQENPPATWVEVDARAAARFCSNEHRSLCDAAAKLVDTANGQLPISLKQPLVTVGRVGLTLGTICALGGDVYAGEHPDREVIGMKFESNNAERTLAEKKAKFKQVFEEWWNKAKSPAPPAKFRGVLEKVVGLINKEARALARQQQARPRVSVVYAYAEHESPSAPCKTIHCVTNSHNTNYALAMQNKNPSVNYHYNSLTLGLSAKRNSGSLFYKMATVNYDHFADAFSRNVWYAGHIMAQERMLAARNAQSNAAKIAGVREAYAILAHALHFASDLFAAGHQRTPRRGIHVDIGNFGGGDCRGDLDKEGIAAMMMHNEDNHVGLWVKNAAGDVWRMYGDEHFAADNNQQNRIQGVKFIRKAIEEVAKAYHTGTITKSDAPDSAIRLLPTVLTNGDAQHRNHPPLFRKFPHGGGHQWRYRTTFPDHPNAQYTADFDCDALVDWFQTSSINSRYNDAAKTLERFRRKETRLLNVFHTQMDTDKSGQVTLMEFKEWIIGTVPQVRYSGLQERVVMKRFFDKFRSLDKATITVADLDVLLSIRVGQQKVLLNLHEFVRVEFFSILRTTPGSRFYKPRSARFMELHKQQLARSVFRFKGIDSRHRSTSAISDAMAPSMHTVVDDVLGKENNPNNVLQPSNLMKPPKGVNADLKPKDNVPDIQQVSLDWKGVHQAQAKFGETVKMDKLSLQEYIAGRKAYIQARVPELSGEKVDAAMVESMLDAALEDEKLALLRQRATLDIWNAKPKTKEEVTNIMEDATLWMETSFIDAHDPAEANNPDAKSKNYLARMSMNPELKKKINAAYAKAMAVHATSKPQEEAKNPDPAKLASANIAVLETVVAHWDQLPGEYFGSSIASGIPKNKWQWAAQKALVASRASKSTTNGQGVAAAPTNDNGGGNTGNKNAQKMPPSDGGSEQPVVSSSTNKRATLRPGILPSKKPIRGA